MSCKSTPLGPPPAPGIGKLPQLSNLNPWAPVKPGAESQRTTEWFIYPTLGRNSAGMASLGELGKSTFFSTCQARGLSNESELDCNSSWLGIFVQCLPGTTVCGSLILDP